MHLTEEEKNLKKKYQKLREKRVQLKRLSEKQQSSSSPLQAKREILNPKDAKEAAKKLLSQGKLSIKKVEVKRTGFKRVGQQGNAPETPPPKKRDTKGSESRRSKGEKEVCMHPLYVVHLFYIHLPVSVHSLSTNLFSIYSTICMYVHTYVCT